MSPRLTLLLLLSVIATSGCMISTQDGERTHVNSPPPEELAFHFDSGFNKMLLYGRTLVLLSLAGWIWRTRAISGSAITASILAAVVMLGAGVLHWQGRSKLLGYRVEVLPSHLHVTLPGEPERVIPWEEIDTLAVEGESNSIQIADGRGQALTEVTRWERLRITCADGSDHAINLRPLSAEQRGNLWRAIVRMAQLERVDGRP